MCDLHCNYNFKKIETTTGFFSVLFNLSAKYEPSAATEHMARAKKIKVVVGNCAQKESASYKIGMVKAKCKMNLF